MVLESVPNCLWNAFQYVKPFPFRGVWTLSWCLTKYNLIMCTFSLDWYDLGMLKLSKFSKILKMSVRSCLLISLIKCLKGHRSLGSLFDVKSNSTLNSQWVTRSPIEQFWTDKKIFQQKKRLNFRFAIFADALPPLCKSGSLRPNEDFQLQQQGSNYPSTIELAHNRPWPKIAKNLFLEIKLDFSERLLWMTEWFQRCVWRCFGSMR